MLHSWPSPYCSRTGLDLSILRDENRDSEKDATLFHFLPHDDDDDERDRK
jgi:hypothetical protein